MIDLHIHSDYSDGSDSPLEILDIVKDRGIKTFSITDHDCVNFYLELERSGGSAKGFKETLKEHNINLVNGIELTTSYTPKDGLGKKKEVHLLYYGFELGKAEIDMFERLRRLRNKVNMESYYILQEKLGKFSFNEEFLDREYEIALSGMHIVRSIIRDGRYGSNVTELINNVLIPNQDPDIYIFEDTIEVIKELRNLSGIISIAHPTQTLNFDEIKHLIEEGAQSVELFHTSISEPERSKLSEIILEYNIMFSVGSDHHGMNTDYRSKIGCFNYVGNMFKDNPRLVVNNL